MLITITSTSDSATDLSFLLHKHPAKVQQFDVSCGVAHVFYPEVTDERCTAALVLEIDPVELVRSKRFGGSAGFSLAQYVNDRPYVASSMMAVALGKVFRSAMAGKCPARPELVDRELPLEIHIPTLPCSGGPDMAIALFAPLGWEVVATSIPLDETVPEWGESRYVDIKLSGCTRLADALTQLYVLLPVLDNAKHYWVSDDEVEKLVRAGDGWLNDHPERDVILKRYLAHKRDLVSTAVGRLAELDDDIPASLDNAVLDDATELPGPSLSLAAQRKAAVISELHAIGSRRVIDLGCGAGALLRELADDVAFSEVVGVDVSHRALEIATRRLNLDRMGDRQRERISLIQSSVTYRDKRLVGFDSVVLMEVIEHVDVPRLAALERTVFGDYQPKAVLVTTPNAEHNVRYETLKAGGFRHPDHRFEWTRQQFMTWAEGTANTYGYDVQFRSIGDDDREVGPPTQMAVFTEFPNMQGTQRGGGGESE